MCTVDIKISLKKNYVLNKRQQFSSNGLKNIFSRCLKEKRIDVFENLLDSNKFIKYLADMDHKIIAENFR